MRVNDRVVYDNKSGTVSSVNDDKTLVDISFDDGTGVDHVPVEHVLLVSAVPVQVKHAYAVGDRVKFWLQMEYVTAHVAKCIVTDDAPCYVLDNDLQRHEDDLVSHPLPRVDDEDMEDLIAEFMTKKIAEGQRIAELNNFDTKRMEIECSVQKDDDSAGAKMTFSVRFGWGNRAQAGTLQAALDECVHREVTDKKNQPKLLTTHKHEVAF